MNAPGGNGIATPSPATGEGAGEANMLDTLERLDVNLIDPSYGINETLDSKMRLIISSLPELEELHNNTPKPFAWFLYPDGRLLDNLDGEKL